MLSDRLKMFMSRNTKEQGNLFEIIKIVLVPICEIPGFELLKSEGVSCSVVSNSFQSHGL